MSEEASTVLQVRESGGCYRDGVRRWWQEVAGYISWAELTRSVMEGETE